MSLDKFISSVRAEVAKRFDLKTNAEIDAFFLGIEESAKDNQEALEKRDKMLRDTVAELCEAKRLLKMAVEDLEEIAAVDECSFPYCGSRCPFDCIGQHWKHLDEALKLIGDESNK